MSETAAAAPVRYDPDGTADFTPDAKPVYWRTGDHRFQVIADPPVEVLLLWVARARAFAEAMTQVGDGDVAQLDEAVADAVRQRIVALFEPLHTPASQAEFAQAVADRQVGLGTVMAVVRWLPAQLGLGSGVPPQPSSDSPAGRPPPAGGSSSTDGQPSQASSSGGSPSPASSTSPGRP